MRIIWPIIARRKGSLIGAVQVPAARRFCGDVLLEVRLITVQLAELAWELDENERALQRQIETVVRRPLRTAMRRLEKIAKA